MIMIMIFVLLFLFAFYGLDIKTHWIKVLPLKEKLYYHEYEKRKNPNLMLFYYMLLYVSVECVYKYLLLRGKKHANNHAQRCWTFLDHAYTYHNKIPL